MRGQDTRARITARRKREIAAEARLRGHNWFEVARMSGYASPGAACAAVGEYLKDHPSEDVEELRKRENLKLDALEVAAQAVLSRFHVTVSQGRIVGKFVGFAKIPGTDEVYLGEDGKPIPLYEDLRDDGPELAAIATLLRIQDRRAKLNGLDQPVRISVEGDSEIDQEIEDLVSAMTGPLNVGEGHPG
jgi:hypothetical protein